MKNKDKSVQILTKGVEFLFKKNKVTYLKGKGVIFSPTGVVVYEKGRKQSYVTKNIVMHRLLSYFSWVQIDEKYYFICSRTFLKSCSKSLVVIGGGYIGLEMGSVWKRLDYGCNCNWKLSFITPGMDREISNEFQKILTKQGIKFQLNSKVISIENLGSNVKVEYQDNETKTKKNNSW